MRGGCGRPFWTRRSRTSARAAELEEVNDLREYMGWTLWDVLAARSTEGESGLIPRQEYETISFLQIWARTRCFGRSPKVGIDGVIEMGRRRATEIGTKLNQLHTGRCRSSPGRPRHRGQLGQSAASAGGEDITVTQWMRRLSTAPGATARLRLRQRVARRPRGQLVDRLGAERATWDDEVRRQLIRGFNATTELLRFMVHWTTGSGSPTPGRIRCPAVGSCSSATTF